jgi:predicted RNA-binding protein
MLDKKVFKEGFERLLIIYPTWGLNASDSNVIRTWYEEFKDLSNERFTNMVSNYIKKEKYNPTVAGLMEHVEKERYRMVD